MNIITPNIEFSSSSTIKKVFVAIILQKTKNKQKPKYEEYDQNMQITCIKNKNLLEKIYFYNNKYIKQTSTHVHALPFYP